MELTSASLEIGDRWHAVGILRDISERKAAEEELKVHRARLQWEVDERAKQLEGTQALLTREKERRTETAEAQLGAERNVRWRLDVEKTLAQVASHLDADADFDLAMNKAMEEVGRFTQADRSYLFLIREDGSTMDNTHEWCAAEVSPQKDELQDLPVSVFPWWMKKLQDREIINIPDVSQLGDEAKAEREVLEAQHIQSVVALPVFVSDELVGFVGFDNVRATEGFGPDELCVLKLLSQIVGSSLARRKYKSALLVEERRYHDLVEGANSIVMALDREARVKFINKYGCTLFGLRRDEVVGSPAIGTMLSDQPDSQRLVEALFAGAATESPESSTQETACKTSDGRDLRVSWSIAPNTNRRGGFAGVVAIGTDVTWRHEAEKEVASTLTKLRQSLRGTIDAIVKVVETRDPYTAGHQRRVASLARAIAAEMGLSEEIVDGIRMAGVIHDIGKIAVPAEILSKPGRITEAEFALIKAHPEVGYQILKDIEFPWPVADIVLQHHERLDGSGYPGGLERGDILMEAKVIAVADVVEAMASHRPYRAALGESAALEEIETRRDDRYDGNVVDACVRLFRTKGFRF